MVTRSLRIAHGNGHNERSLIAFAHSSGADSVGMDEANRLWPDLRRMTAWRPVRAGSGRARGDCVILTHRNLRRLRRLAVLVSRAWPPALRVAPDRYMPVTYYRHPVADALGVKGVAHFELHPVAGPRALNGVDTNHPLVKRYRAALVEASRRMGLAQQRGYLVVLTGDLQVPSSNDRMWSPRRLLAAHLGLKYRTVGIDWLLYDPRLLLVDFLPRELFDHTGFVADFVPKP